MFDRMRSVRVDFGGTRLDTIARISRASCASALTICCWCWLSPRRRRGWNETHSVGCGARCISGRLQAQMLSRRHLHALLVFPPVYENVLSPTPCRARSGSGLLWCKAQSPDASPCIFCIRGWWSWWFWNSHYLHILKGAFARLSTSTILLSVHLTICAQYDTMSRR